MIDIFFIVGMGFVLLMVMSYLFMLFFDDIIDFIGLGKMADRWEEKLRLKYMKERENE